MKPLIPFDQWNFAELRGLRKKRNAKKRHRKKYKAAIKTAFKKMLMKEGA